MHELILGGQKSGKSRCAEQRALQWLAAGAPREALLIATALAGDAEMRERIERHRADRAARVPALAAIEAPHALPEALRAHGAAQRLLVVDCLTLWLTQCLLPPPGHAAASDGEAAADALLAALRAAPGPVVLVSNEIGLGGIAMGREARRFADALGRLHQRVAEVCARVTLMVAGLAMTVKEPQR
ncbi:MAG TPA: bifunctional adenosylcobinamide kinase/adenosylcobinamide-phosphate guanylyltransferase [Methylibium sp.]|uniref:bifunctional adenosylcobinamide kinase/adenosylcobinamide-phosphate guanylyltransferase n=1 Tax=Methylibium sp. TaxID=2067992 RepID=UPI002DBB57D1|nr:bifunctional adenosylcobinamide kinase/adenosylcobinamide-phosphate guanylyltransferase [Methylibium sp.]HEU4459889.1 bifunctional adenosylcobinamide kinase/adenosylcobinamide-phosphate guanylyltransferase [Methylibium sp.]